MTSTTAGLAAQENLTALLTVPAIPLGEVLARSYATYAERTAVIGQSRTLTYGQLRDRARSVAGGLSGLGCSAGDRVVLISPNATEWFEVDHACYLGGFVRVGPLTRLHTSELTQIVEDADPRVLLADSGWLAETGTDWIPPGIRHVVSIGGEALPGTACFEDLVSAGAAVEFPPGDVADDVWITYTSGSTGQPKGVQSTGRGTGAMLRNTLVEMDDLSPDDVAVHTAPLSHFSGVIALAVFATGGTNVVYPTFDPARLASALGNREVSVLPLVPTQINMLVDDLIRRRDAGSPVDTAGLRKIPYAGSAIAPDRLARAKEAFGEVLLQFYGSSECPMPLTALQPEEHRAGSPGSGGLPRLASAGRKNRFVDLEIRDSHGNSTPPGTSGEICARGEQTMRGYWRQPEATAEVVDEDGWVSTGDIGFVDEDGFLFIMDRKKDLIITGGFNVYPREIENVISLMSEVREVAVVGAPSQRWGEEIVAVVSLQPGAELTPADVIAFCRNSIAGYKVPKRVTITDDLPKSGTGKIQKRTIANELWKQHDRRV